MSALAALKSPLGWMGGRSFQFKLIVIVLFIQIITVGGIEWVSNRLIDSALCEQVRLQLLESQPLLNAALAENLAKRDFAVIQDILRQVQSEQRLDYLVILDTQNKIIGSVGWDERRPLPEIDAAVALEGDDFYDQSMPLTVADRTYGNLHYGLSLKFLQQTQQRLLRDISLIFFVGFLLTVALLIWFGLPITRRLMRLNEASKQIAAGNLEIRIEDSSADEIGQLARGFNLLTSSLFERIRELRTSEERLALALRGTADGIWDWDLVNEQYYMSPRFKEMLGYSDDEMPNSREAFLGSVHPDDRDRVHNEVQTHFKSRTPYATEFRLQHKDGNYRWFQGRGQAVWDDAGKVIRFTGANADIDLRKRVEDHAQALLHENQALLDNALVGIVHLRQRTIVSCNRRFEELFGYAPGHMLGQPTTILYPDQETYEMLGAEAYPVISSGKTYDREIQMRRKDGSVFWGHGSGRAINPDRPEEGSIWIYSDITERKNALESLRREKDFSDATINSLPGFFYLLDETQKIVRWNTNFAALTGYSEAEIGQLSPKKIFLPDELPVIRQAWLDMLNKGEVAIEAQLVTREGRTIPHIFSGTFVEISGRRHVIGVGIDISDKKHAEEQIRKLNEELEFRVAERTAELTEANQELESFSYTVSHDLSAPLRSINGFSRILEEDYAALLDATGRNYIQRIQLNTQRMQSLIDNLLTLARISRGEMRRDTVNFSAMAEEIIADLRLLQPQRQVETVIAPGLAADGDGGLLHIVLDNLLRNAWKFTSKHAAARIEMGALSQNQKIVYFVRDDGAGFDMSYASSLFGAFRRLHSVTDFDGTGIGLASVSRVIQRHGGQIWAESAVEQGATFYFTLS